MSQDDRGDLRRAREEATRAVGAARTARERRPVTELVINIEHKASHHYWGLCWAEILACTAAPRRTIHERIDVGQTAAWSGIHAAVAAHGLQTKLSSHPTMSISVVIPTHNGAQYLGHTIESVQ